MSSRFHLSRRQVLTGAAASAVVATALDVTAAPSASAATAAPTIEDVALLAANSAFLTQRERMAKGGVVGVGNKGVVVFRWDDFHDLFQSTIFPMLQARALPVGFVCISRFDNQAWAQATTWDQVRNWARNGVEIWCHGTDHKDPSPDGDAGIYREIVTSRTEIEAQSLKVVGFAPPGTTPLTSAQPFGTKWSTPEDYNTYTGRLIQATYGISDGYMAGGFRNLPHGVAHGLQSTIIMTDGGTTKAEVIAVIDKAIERRQQVQLFSHAGNIGKPGNMTLTEITEVLDYVVAKREAGLLEVLTPSAAYFASSDSTRRIELYRHGDWAGIRTGDDRWKGWGNKTIQTDGGHSGAEYLRMRSGDATYLSLLTDNLDQTGVMGEQFMFEAWVRTTGGPAALDVLMIDATSAALRPTLAKSKVVSGGQWQKFMFPFGLYPTQAGVNVHIRRASGSGSLDIDDVRIYKI